MSEILDIKNRFFEVAHFLASHEQSSIFLIMAKNFKAQKQLKILVFFFSFFSFFFLKILAILHENFFRNLNTFSSISPEFVLDFELYLSQLHCSMKEIDWALGKYGNHSLYKLVIDPKIRRPPHQNTHLEPDWSKSKK